MNYSYFTQRISPLQRWLDPINNMGPNVYRLNLVIDIRVKDLCLYLYHFCYPLFVGTNLLFLLLVFTVLTNSH